jgi:ADP-ribose pyrophosphatase YjhB (NUDIX family)
MNPFVTMIDNMVELPPKIQTRDAVRAVILKDRLVLLMFSEKDQMYGTPGGGITLNESKLDTLYRELLEEVGAHKVRIVEHLGQSEELRESRSLHGKPINIISDYYLVEVLEFIHASLEDHEEEMGLRPTWIDIDQAIDQNERKLHQNLTQKLNFFHTQTAILKYIKDRFGL